MKHFTHLAADTSCGDCGKPLSPDEPVLLLPCRGATLPLCLDCTHRRLGTKQTAQSAVDEAERIMEALR